MTAHEFYRKYGDVMVTFSSYFKHKFIFAATLSDGRRITCECGGNADDIYRLSVVEGEQESINNLQPLRGGVYQEDGKEIEGFDDY